MFRNQVDLTALSPLSGRVWPLLAAILLLSGLLAAGPPAVRGELLLNEILADPARDWNMDGGVSSRDDEWVEIINTGPAPLNLAGCRLAGPDSVWRYEFSGVLGVNQVAVVYGRQSYDWEVAQGFPAYGLRLSNTGGTVALFKVEGTQAQLLDSYTYKDHEAEDDRSSGRGPDGSPRWILLDGYTPYTGAIEPVGSGCFPSPGTVMSCPTPADPVTWGLIKQVFAR